MEELKLYCVVSREAVDACKGVRGKMATQAGHAYCGALLDALERFPERAKDYIESAAVPKITLVASEAQLHELWRAYKDKFGVALIRDAGRTVFAGPTITALGVGPILASEREELLTQLRPWT